MRHENHISIRDSYTMYRKAERQSTKPVDKKTYIAVANQFMEFIFDKIVEGKTVTLPSRMGQMGIVGRRRKLKTDEDGNIITKLPVDWPNTKKLWEKCPECEQRKDKIYFLNEHSNGVSYKVVWSHDNLVVENKSLYSFQLSRWNKRESSAGFREGKEYHILDPKERKIKPNEE